MDLIEACKEGNIERVKELLKQGVDPTADDNLAIIYASFFGHTDVVEALLQDGRADPTTENNYPIGIASAQGYTSIVSFLLQDGRADPAVDVNYAIRRASYNGHTDVVKLLLQDGRVEPTDNDAIEAATDEIKEMLVSYRYRVDGDEYCRLKENLK